MFGLASYMLFAFTLVEIHVVLPLYVKNFLGMGGNVFASAEIYYSFGAIFSGLLILNRLIWIATGVFVLLISYFSFSFQEKNKKVKTQKEDKKVSKQIFTLPKISPIYTGKTEWSQFKSFFLINFLSIVRVNCD